MVITGVSRGLGAALFEQLATDPGNRVLGLGRHFTAEQRAAAGAEPHRIRLHTVDLAGAVLGLRTPLDAAIRDTGPPVEHAVLILNAGVVEPVGAVGALPDADVARSVAVNLTAPMLVAGAFVAALAPGTRATIVNVSSGAATRPIEGWAPYCAAKAGGEMFFRVLAAERPDLRVVSVNPGRMDTRMQAALRESSFPSRQSYVDAHEQGRLADPADVAARVISEHITGE
jgi:NAD(P)-dependent dehydrogenase (short-subunit alcohol dehydrogenase family)